MLTLDGAEGTGNAMGLLGAPIEQVPVDVHDDVVVLPYSSGTTGLPKGVMLTHYNLVANIAQVQPIFKLREHEVMLCLPPVLPHLRHAGADEHGTRRWAPRS